LGPECACARLGMGVGRGMDILRSNFPHLFLYCVCIGITEVVSRRVTGPSVAHPVTTSMETISDPETLSSDPPRAGAVWSWWAIKQTIASKVKT
jgi:hypothetical protein